MLPYSNFKWNQQPLVQVWRKLSGENEEVKLQEYDATNCVSLFEEALRDNKVLVLKLFNLDIYLKLNSSV